MFLAKDKSMKAGIIPCPLFFSDLDLHFMHCTVQVFLHESRECHHEGEPSNLPTYNNHTKVLLSVNIETLTAE